MFWAVVLVFSCPTQKDDLFQKEKHLFLHSFNACAHLHSWGHAEDTVHTLKMLTILRTRHATKRTLAISL